MVGDGAASLGDLRGRVVNVKAILEVGQYLNGARRLYVLPLPCIGVVIDFGSREFPS